MVGVLERGVVEGRIRNGLREGVMFISMKKRASNRDGHEWKSPDVDRVISMLHEYWKPQVFGLVTVAEQSEGSVEATFRNYSMWKMKINVYFSFDLQSFYGICLQSYRKFLCLLTGIKNIFRCYSFFRSFIEVIIIR
jgi:hypothetical protein